MGEAISFSHNARSLRRSASRGTTCSATPPPRRARPRELRRAHVRDQAAPGALPVADQWCWRSGAQPARRRAVRLSPRRPSRAEGRGRLRGGKRASTTGPMRPRRCRRRTSRAVQLEATPRAPTRRRSRRTSALTTSGTTPHLAPTRPCCGSSRGLLPRPEEEVQRGFDFLGLERADVSLKAFEEDHVKKYVARPGRSPPPPPPPRRARTADERLAANHRAFDSYFGF